MTAASAPDAGAGASGYSRAMWMILLVCSLLSFPAAASGSEPRVPDGPIVTSREELLAPTPDELDELVTRLLPLVEEAAGRSFVFRPEVVATHPAELSRVFYREQMYMLGRLSELGPEEAHEAARATAGSISSAFVGKYGFLDKRLYVISEGVSLALQGLGFPDELAREVLEVVLAHELAHALQDQHNDLGRLVGSRPDGDAIMAANCMVEGHAVWVHEQVGRRLGHHHAVRAVATIQGYDPDEAESPLDPRRLFTSYVYGRGRAFVDWHARDGGTERLWELLSRPPASTAMILQPGTYTPEVQAPVSKAVRKASRRVVEQLGDPAWPFREERLGDFDLREQLADRIGNVTLADQVEAAWQSRAARRDAMEGAEVRVLRFRSPEAARTYVDHMGRRARLQLDRLSRPRDAEASFTGRVDGFDALKADVSARESLMIDVDGRTQALSTLWVARGADVVQVVTVNRTISDPRLARVLHRLFAALD